ncbi:MAG: hypothetical protein M1504_02350 [Candidatus Marsarchaeota archaeon]|nr:hypothetical protein [Candidatus Marsarchaeota archaeon]
MDQKLHDTIFKGKGQQRRDSETCSVCSMPAEFTCKMCGKKVCRRHFDPAKGICTMCKVSREREEHRFEEPPHW